MVFRTERGWAAHCSVGSKCLFRRHTLLEKGDVKIIVSTVGAYVPAIGTSVTNYGMEPLGSGGRYYETMAFETMMEGVYLEADVCKPVDFTSKGAICADSHGDLPADVDNHADRMHEAVVAELMVRLKLEGEVVGVHY